MALFEILSSVACLNLEYRLNLECAVIWPWNCFLDTIYEKKNNSLLFVYGLCSIVLNVNLLSECSILIVDKNKLINNVLFKNTY